MTKEGLYMMNGDLRTTNADLCTMSDVLCMMNGDLYTTNGDLYTMNGGPYTKNDTRRRHSTLHRIVVDLYTMSAVLHHLQLRSHRTTSADHVYRPAYLCQKDVGPCTMSVRLLTRNDGRCMMSDQHCRRLTIVVRLYRRIDAHHCHR